MADLDRIESIRVHDLRDLGLRSASERLNMTVVDLGVIREARARAETRLCPLCEAPHPLMRDEDPDPAPVQ